MLATLAVSTGTWVVIAVIAVPLVTILVFFGGFIGARHLEDVSTARRFGWADASELFGSTAVLDEQGWIPHQYVYITKHRGDADEANWWHKYVNCDTQITADGIALRYRGRLRSGSEPVDHPALFFPWNVLNTGIRGDLKGDGRRGTVTTIELLQLPHVALALLDPDADRIAAASGGQWRITPAPPTPL